MASLLLKTPAGMPDSELVAVACSGDRAAFEEIVGRYQGLVCSLAFSSVGDLTLSEDVAQETFVAAWKALPQLREPGKLKSWLCGIVRKVGANRRRKEGREPVAGADPLDLEAESDSSPDNPADLAARRDDADLVWRALANIPEVYREPMILYYRGQHSVECVAEALDLSEDAVKQRLARGRERLRAEVAAVVDGALRASAPGPTFTQSVMAALPLTALSSKLAVGGALAGKTSVAAAGATGVLVGTLAGMAGAYLSYRQCLKYAQSEAERKILRSASRITAAGALFVVAFTIGAIAVCRNLHVSLWLGFGIGAALIPLYALLTLASAATTVRRLKALEGGGTPLGGWMTLEYRSRGEFLGMPFLHIRFGGSPLDQYRPVKAWIAMGGVAMGGLFAFGGISLAPISMGGLAFGCCALGGTALGGIALGGMAMGAVAVGGLAIGWASLGGVALAVKMAWGGVAVARDYAFSRGGAARALHANDAAASDFLRDHGFLRWGLVLLRVLPWLSLLGFLPFAGWWLERRGRKGLEKSTG